MIKTYIACLPVYVVVCVSVCTINQGDLPQKMGIVVQNRNVDKTRDLSKKM